MSEITRLLWVRVFLFGVWLVMVAGALGIVDPAAETATLGVVLLAAISGLAVLRPFRGSHIVLAMVAAVCYALLQGLRAAADDADPNAPYLPAAAVGAFGFVLTAIVADTIRNSLLAYDEELSSRQRVIEELEAIDMLTGAVKRPHAQRMIAGEVERGRRYGRNVSVVMVGPDAWEEVLNERGAEAAEQLVSQVSHAYIEHVRSIDRIIHLQGPDFGALLPETDLEGAQVVAEKLCALGTDLFGTQVRAGIASFPEDDVTGTGLVAEAEEALEFARMAQITVASRSLLS